MSEANREQIAFWNEQAGPTWVSWQDRLDAQIRAHGELVLDVLALAAGERVLDVGCGCGGSTLEMARRVGPSGEVLGVDISAPMLARASARAREAGLEHVRFVGADAHTTDLGKARFDAVASRFGVMFFDDPKAAFRNVGRALRPGGRLAFVCWQSPPRNPWVMVPMAAAAPLLELPPPPPPDAPGMFAFADPDRVREILEGAGWVDVTLDDVHVPMTPGDGSPDEAARVFLEVGPVAALLREQQADEALRRRVGEAVRAAFEARRNAGRLELDSAVWRVQARRPA